jgi:two-component system, chemotaxis family, protein-glutamate methylesterase/glutaminase
MAGQSIADRIEAVVIGASAGGVEALSVLLPALPADVCAPVFAVLHLPRERPSLLADIFGPKCRVPVREAVDKDAIEPGTIYFAPPDYHLLIDAGAALALSADEPVHHSRPSIDVLFETAAEVFGAGLLAILLTGGNQDGAAGLATVREAGGLTVVQDPAEAHAPMMVEAALARGPVDYQLRLAAIADLLRRLRTRGSRRG